MVSTKGIIALAVAIAVALGALFVINKFVLNREFDVATGIISIIVVGIILWAGSMASARLTGTKGVVPPKAPTIQN